MLMAGVDDFTVMEIVGHLTKAMLQRYAHPPQARKRAALETFNHVLFGHDLGTRKDTETDTPPATVPQLVVNA
jgi:hypothetical protein